MSGALCSAGSDPSSRDDSFLRQGQWQVSVGYRKQNSFRHFVGTVEQKDREELETQIVNDIHLFDVAVTYAATPRLNLSVGLPLMYATRTRPGKLDQLRGIPNAPDQVFHSAGLGDLSLSARVWLARPPSEAGQNVAFGVGLKLPTGKSDVRDTVRTPTGPVTQVVDQSIQLGDGGVGVTLDVQAFKALKFATLYLSGTYLINPRNTNGVLTGRGRASEAVMSVSDQYLARGGVVLPFPAVRGLIPRVRGLALGFGGRIEGVPVRDLIGKSEGFRRPGYAISVEPSLFYTKGKNTWSLSAPIAVERNRRRSVPDIADGRAGDAAFADYVLLLGYSRRF